MALRRSVLTHPATVRLLVTAVVIGAGAVIGLRDGTAGLTGSDAYRYFVTALLAVGLYGSTCGIDVRHLRGDLRTVTLAVTVGVFLKAVLISAVMFAAFRRPEFLVLGVAVAQIDPLSVTALQSGSRMSERGKALLLAWASFDDPVTTLLTIYAATLTVAVTGRSGAGLGASGGDLTGFAADLARNGGFALAVFAVWGGCALLGRWSRRHGPARLRRAADAPSLRRAAAGALLTAALVVAVANFWMLGIALVGLFLRPVRAAVLGGATQAAFVLATFALGLILALGVSPVPGLLLGVTAFLAQAAVSRPVTRGQDRKDRHYLAMAQQNGITAIILALLLERDFPGTVAVVAPAILVINVLHVTANALYERGGATIPRRVLGAVFARGHAPAAACSPPTARASTAAREAARSFPATPHMATYGPPLPPVVYGPVKPQTPR